MQTALLLASMVVGALVVGIVVLAVLLGWTGEAIARPQRIGLCLIAAGLVGAGADRALQRPVGIFDLLFLLGLGLYLSWTYGPALHRRADALDGKVDGRVQLLGGRRQPR